MELLRLASSIAAEPASIIYIVTGAVGFCIARLRSRKKLSKSSIVMLFCRRSSRDALAEIKLLEA